MKLFSNFFSTAVLVSLLATAGKTIPLKVTTLETSDLQVLTSDAGSVQIRLELTEPEISSFFSGREEISNIKTITPEGINHELPELPQFSRFLILPPGTKPVLEVESEPFPTDHLSQIGELSAPANVRGVNLIKVTLHPIIWDNESQNYLIINPISAKVRFEPDESARNREFPALSPQFRRFLKAVAINPEVIGRDEYDAEPANAGHYLVAAHENCIRYIAPFIEWRRKSGWLVDILSIPAAVAAANPREVKARIQARYDAYRQAGEEPFEEILLVGDRSFYTWPPVAGWVLDAERGSSTWPVPQHADYTYALLEGGADDPYPDAGISRWCAGSPDILQLFVNRTLAYEAYPHTRNPAWFTRGAVFSQHWGNDPQTAWHPSLHTNLRWANQVLREKGFDDLRFYEDYNYDQDGRRIGEFERRQFNDGVNLMLGRAEDLLFAQNLNGINENQIFPLRITLSGHGEYATWTLLRTGDGQHLRGPVVSTCNWGGPPTVPTSAFWLGTVSGLLQHNLSYGWARNLAIFNVEKTTPNYEYGQVNVYNHIRTDNDFYGDPGLTPWLTRPQTVITNAPPQITPQNSYLRISVLNAQSRLPVKDARVTLYAPGEMPAFDNPEYVPYNDMKMWTRQTGGDGGARFIFNEGLDLTPGELLLVTVTGRDVIPLFDTVQVVENIPALDLSSYRLEETQGNGDGEINPGERFRMSLTAVNLGREVFNGVRGRLLSLSPYVQIEENNEFDFGDIAGGSETESNPLPVLSFSVSCPDGAWRPSARPVLQLRLNSGENQWVSRIELEPQAPGFSVAAVNNNGIVPFEGLAQPLIVTIRNEGRQNGSPLTAQLAVQNGWGLNILNAQAGYPAIDVNSTAVPEAEGFRILVDTRGIPGAQVNLRMALEMETGFCDTVIFPIRIGEPQANAPTGPDDYGWIAYDNTDQDWSSAPDYDWLEINPRDQNADYEGVALPFAGRSVEDVGEAIALRMPFSFRFYGRDYDSLTIGTNGYLCPGNQSGVVNFQNWPLDLGFGGGAGMIAVFWDWLRMYENSAVWTYYDEPEGRFIIEWSQFRHHSGGEGELNFQVVLYNPQTWAVETGETPWLFQYKNITNVAGEVDIDRDTPYASVGLASPDGLTGFSWTYLDQYPVSAAPLANRRAIKLTTSPREHHGVVRGTVRSRVNEQILAGAVVKTGYGLKTIADQAGSFVVERVVNEALFSITASNPGFRDTTFTNLVIPESDTLRLDIFLTPGINDMTGEEPALVPSMLALNVFPTPANNQFSVSLTLPAEGAADITLYDAAGRLALKLDSRRLEAGQHNWMVDASALANGLYLVRVRTKDDYAMQKMVIIK